MSKIEGPKKLVKRAQFVADYYGIDPIVELAWSDNEDYSECTANTDGTYKIDIASFLTGSALMETIAHEMTHVQQYESGALIPLFDEERYVWKDKKYGRIITMEDYLMSPWEMEARAMEFVLAWKWSCRKK